MPSADSGGRRIAAGFYHSLVVQEEEARYDADPLNSVFGFGSNRNHVLGLEDGVEFSNPTPIGFFNDKYISEVGCGGSHSVFLEKRPDQDGGIVWVVGLGTSGRLGLERPRDEDQYRELLLSSGYEQTDVDVLVTNNAGEVVDALRHQNWCLQTPVKLKVLESIVHISCGVDHTLALSEPGVVWAWGLGSFGNLGTGSTEDCFTPTKVRIPQEHPCRSVAAGSKHSMALTRGGLMYSWGHGGNGRLGQGDKREASLEPGEVKVEPAGVSMKWIAVGEAHSASVDVLGNVFCWGAGTRGRTGHGEEIDSPRPKQVRSLGGNPCTEVALGALHSIALEKNGAVHSWGSGCATGHEAAAGGLEAVQPIPKELTARLLRKHRSSRVVHVAAGSFHSLALLADSSVISWGNASHGRLGRGALKLSDQSAPDTVQLTRADGVEALEPEVSGTAAETSGGQSICCGGMHSGFLNNGDLWLWGSNDGGQLGFGDRKDRLHPSRLLIKELEMAKRKIFMVAFGLEHCLLLTTEATAGARLLFSWGRNHAGQLGLGNTKDEIKPTQISFIVDVKKIAAGEDHSAALLSSGELYTWGSAQCGKLGHGSGVGSQNYPMHLRLSDQVDEVSCGAQHTAFLNVQGHLFTCGAGWFGRLGHGELSNQTSPKKVETFDMAGGWDGGGDADAGGGKVSASSPHIIAAPQVKDVKCGTYHTCIVTMDSELWCCGRDSMICESTHVHRPIRFGRGSPQLFGDATAVKVQAVAAGAHHTMCLTRRGDLWIWGENNKGQLGLGEGSGSRLVQPATVKFSERAANSDVVGIAAGHAHSMAMLKSGEVYAWGSTGGGRLGLAVDVTHHDHAWLPKRVDARWIDEQGGATPGSLPSSEQLDEKSEPTTTHPRGGPESPREQTSEADDEDGRDVLGELRRKLQAQVPEKTLASLRKKEADLSAQLREHFQHITRLWDKPAAGSTEASEWELRDLRSRFDRSLCQNLRRLNLAEEYPNLDGLLIQAEVSQVLVYYEELIWILQQHPCYLARLSQIKLQPSTKSVDVAFPEDFFPVVVGRIFREMGNSRTRHLLMALIRRVIELELGQREKPSETSIDGMLDSQTSRVHVLMRIFVTHPFFKDLHWKFFNPDDQESLLTEVCKWTLQMRKEEAVFALECQDLPEWEKTFDQRVMSEKEHAKEMAHLRTRLTEHHRVFEKFVKTDFIVFIEKLQLHPEIRCLLAKAADTLCQPKQQPSAQEAKVDRLHQLSKGEGEQQHEPIAKLLMTGVIGHLLTAHEAIMSSQLLSEKFETKVRTIVKDYLSNESGVVDEQDVVEEVPKAIKKIHFNLTQLGKFLTLAASRNGFKSGSTIMPTLSAFLRDDCLLKYTKRQVDEGRRDTDIGIELTVDFYTSHFDTSEHFVMLRTSELLHLSNALWFYIDTVVPGEKQPEDRLYALLDKIQPPVGTSAAKDRERMWTKEVLQHTTDKDMMHNFIIFHRFLEFHKSSLCFCCECEAPIPRSFAPERQRQRKDAELLKVYPEFEGHTEFLDLESVLANKELTMDLKQAKNFITLKYKLEEIQKSIGQKLYPTSQDDKAADGYVLLTEIEKGKKSLDLLRNMQITMQKFTEYLSDALKSRERHYTYLQTIQRRLKEEVSACQVEYEENLKKRLEALRRIVKASESVAVPQLFKNKAADQAVRPRLADVEKLRRKELKKDREFDERESPVEFYSSASFSLYNLLAKKVVRRMEGALDAKEHRNIFFTFNYMESGDWEVVVIHKDVGKSHVLCTLHITLQDIERMKRAGKSEKRKFNNGFVVMSCFSLLQLLARIRASNFSA